MSKVVTSKRDTLTDLEDSRLFDRLLSSSRWVDLRSWHPFRRPKLDPAILRRPAGILQSLGQISPV